MRAKGRSFIKRKGGEVRAVSGDRNGGRRGEGRRGVERQRGTETEKGRGRSGRNRQSFAF